MSLPRTQTFAVNANNDLYVDNEGNIAIVFDIQAVLQNCEHAIKTRLGEMVLQVNGGLPYLEAVFVGVPNIPQYEAAARAAILAVQGVQELILFNAIQTQVIPPFSTRPTTALVYSAIIRTIYGQANLSGEVFNG
jgi:hypothetical protein